jgi:hypothetical protein
LLSLWFDSKHHKEPWYIGNRVAEAEERLRQVKPPDSIGRIPKVFRGRGWKATECRTFLLYYLPILKGILPDRYLAHAFLLSKSIRILLSNKVIFDDIDVAENLLLLFWRRLRNTMIVTSFILQWRLHVQRKLTHGTPILTAFVSSLTSRQTRVKRQLTDSLCCGNGKKT